MAEGGQDSKSVNVEECPICKEEVTSIRILPCSHPFCDDCLTKLIESTKDFLCPICRQACANPKEAIRKFFGEIKCPSCFKTMDVDDFYWCVECQNLMCCRCVAKNHRQTKHELLDWNTRKAYTACFRALSNSEVILNDQVANAINLLLKPIIDGTVESISKSSRAQKDFGRFLAETYGIKIGTIGTGYEPGSGPNAPNLMKVLGTLAGLTLPIDPKVLGRPCRIRNPERVRKVLMEELEFSQKHHSNLNHSTPTQLNSPTTILKNSTKTVGATGLEPSVTREISAVAPGGWDVKLRKNNSFVQNLRNGHFRLGPFSNSEEGQLILGPIDSNVVVNRNQAFFFTRTGSQGPRNTGWTVHSIEAKNNHCRIVTAAIDASNGLHLIAIHENQLTYFFWTSESNKYELKNITGDGDKGGRVIDATICCTHTGIPYFFVVLKNAGSREIRSVLYKFGNHGSSARKYEFADIVDTIYDSHVYSASVVRKAQQKQWILGADCTGVHMFRRYFDKTILIKLVNFFPMRTPTLCSYGTLVQQVVIKHPSDQEDDLQDDDDQEVDLLRCYEIKDDKLIALDAYWELEEETSIAGYQENELVEYKFDGSRLFEQIYHTRCH